MRRLARHLFTFASALSFLLCLATCVLWFRSYHLSDQLLWYRVDGQRILRSARGQLVLSLLLADHSNQPPEYFGLRYQRDIAYPHFPAVKLFIYPDPRDKTSEWNWHGFSWYRRLRYDGVRY